MSLPKLHEDLRQAWASVRRLQDKNRMQEAAADLGKITGQKPQITKGPGRGQRLPVAWENNEIGCRVL